MKKTFFFLLLAGIYTKGFCQQTTIPDTTKNSFKVNSLMQKNYIPYYPIKYSPMVPGTKNYFYSSQKTGLKHEILYAAGHIFMNVLSDRLGYRYEPFPRW